MCVCVGGHFGGAEATLFRRKTKPGAHDDDVMMKSHIKILKKEKKKWGGGWWGWDTYFQQLAVLGTAQQRDNKTKEREAEIRVKGRVLHLTIRRERVFKKEGRKQNHQSQRWRKARGGEGATKSARSSSSICK